VGCVVVVSVTRRSSGVAPRACVRMYMYARVLVPPNLYIHTYIDIGNRGISTQYSRESFSLLLLSSLAEVSHIDCHGHA